MEGQRTARIERIEPSVWTPKAKLHIPHKEDEITFAYPSFGPGNYRAIGKQILEKTPGKNLKVPIGDEIASLLYSVYCDSSVSEKPEFQDIQKELRSKWLWCFNINIFTEDGVYVIQDLEANGRAEMVDLNVLESRLTEEREGIKFSEDGLMRFAQKQTYKLGEHTPDSLAQDGFIKASYGFEGAKKLGEVSTKFNKNLITYGIKVGTGDSPEQRVSALGEVDCGLGVGGGFDGSWGHALGVFESCEAGAKNKSKTNKNDKSKL